MARGNYEDRILKDAIRDLRLTSEEEQALGNYMHAENESPKSGDYQSAVEFIREFLDGPWRQYLHV